MATIEGGDVWIAVILGRPKVQTPVMNSVYKEET